MNNHENAAAHCCANCGRDGGASLKMCKSCMHVWYCNAECQKNHWPTHKIECKLRAAELRDEALFKDPPPKEECPICFLPMPMKLICCVTLPPATTYSVPIYDFANANTELAQIEMETYYPCCGKSICDGCIYSFRKSRNDEKCPFCNSDRASKTEDELHGEVMKRAAANDPASICMLANFYRRGIAGFPQDHVKAMELNAMSAELGFSKAYCNLGKLYHDGGNLKKAKFHYEAAAMAGYAVARYNLGHIEFEARNIERAVKHWTIAASDGDYHAMNNLIKLFEQGYGRRDAIDSALKAYNNSCVEMRSEARDAHIQQIMSETNETDTNDTSH